MELIALAIAPGLAICLFIFHRDVYNREPKLNLFVSFGLGAIAVLPAALIELSLIGYTNQSIAGVAITAFLVVALTEEFVKFLVLRFYAYPKKSFDEPLDGIVYGVMTSMGFATVENILYVQEYGIQTGIMRMFVSVPAHASFGVLMGYFVGKAKFDTPRSKQLAATGLFWAVLFHGIFDFFLFLQGNPNVSPYISDLLLFAGAVASFTIAVRLSLNHIKRHRLLSQQTFNPTGSLTIRKAWPGDIALIRQLAWDIWPVTYEPILGEQQVTYMLNLLYNEQTIREQMENHIEYIIVHDGPKAVGFAAFGVEEPGVYKLHKIYVLPSQQGKGTGRYIINELAAAMKKKGARALRLNVNRYNKARIFYEKMGFSVIREEDIDIGKGYFMNDYVMEKSL